MKERLILVFRSRARGTETSELARRRALIEQAIRDRGELCAWSATSFAVDFPAANLEHAVRFLVEVLGGGGKRPFAVGVATGALEISKMGQGTVAWGSPLSRATALASVARPGEVLVDGELDHGRRLLFLGSTRQRLDGKIVCGRRLDLAHPFREPLSAGIHELVTPLLVGRPELFNLRLLPGTVSIIRVPPGHGGSRFLGELGRSLSPSRVLRISGASVSDPMGALRRAVVKAVGAKPGFRPAEARSLDMLWGGKGPDLDSCAALISAWLHTDEESTPTGAVLIDDATHVDRDSLEAVALAAMHPEAPCAVVIRIGLGDSIPDELAPMQRGSEVVLGELPHRKAAALASAWFAGQLETKTAYRYAGRAGQIPLGIVEALSEALEVGDVAWSEGVARARVRHGGRGRARSPRVYIARRLRWLTDDEHMLLWAIAVLGNEARTDDVSALCKRRLGRALDVEPLREKLLPSGWLKPTDKRLIALSSTSQGETLLAELRSLDLERWDRDAAEVLAASSRPLAAAAAAVHAALAGETVKSARYATWAAAASEAAGFDETALMLRRFAEHPDTELLAQRRLWTRDVRPAGRLSSASIPTGDRASFASPSIPVEAPEPESDDLRRVNVGAVSALRDRDAARLVEVASQAREVGRVELATRLDALAALLRKEGGEAQRILRQQAARHPEDGARTQLALAVSLAECGEPREAILEALTVLATTRRTSDVVGERAAAAVLARLSAAFGTQAAARPWVTAVRG